MSTFTRRVETLQTPTRVPVPTVAEQVKELLKMSSFYSLRKVTCNRLGGEIVLAGTVSSFHLKQVAQEIAASVVNRGGIRNQIRVGSF